jgi:prolyl 4-hydroxylase|eukprot:31030-Pelagococcus_subviridis.AAC.4
MAGARRLPLLLLAIVVALPVGNVRAAFSLRGSDTRRDERLIGWLGEVPRADATTTTREAPRADDASASSLGPTRDIGVGDARVEKLSDSPRAYLFREFLTKEECAHLIEISTPHLKRSTVVGDDALLGEADGRRSDYRTSTGAFLPKLYDDVVTRVERRVEAFSRLPFENQEQLQARSVSLCTLSPGVSLRPSPHAHDPLPRRLTTPLLLTPCL